MRTIRYNINQEDILSRLPALFAYIETDDFGKTVLHKATDAPMGCYGKVVENIDVNGETMTYRTLMTQYYDIKDTHPENGIVAFVDRAIGKIKVTDEIDFEECILCPEYVYVATIPYLYDEYVKMKKICDNGDKNDAEVCCICDKYSKMGGDKILDFLSANYSAADAIAEEYYQHAKNSKKQLSIDINVNLVTSENDMGIVTPYIEQYQLGRLYEEGDVVARNEGGIWGIYNATAATTGHWDEDLMGRIFDSHNFTKKNNLIYEPKDGFIIEGQCDSLLKSLRRNKEYLNTYDEVERPSFGRDWLFYYRVGNVSNVKSIKDNLGNIMCINPDKNSIERFLPMSESSMEKVGDVNSEYIINLYAYGDVITYIGVEDIDNSPRLVIKYMTDAHLKAKSVGTDTDDDGNKLFLLNNFVIDTDSAYGRGHGIEYTEVFDFNVKGEIDDLLKSGDFENYVNGESEDDLFKKCEFITDNAVNTVNKRVGMYGNIKDSFNVATFKTNGMIPTEVQEVKLFRHDYYQGISYAPNRDISVEIDRGYTSAFEKHIKFSEVNTLEDMENGNFFKMSEWPKN